MKPMDMFQALEGNELVVTQLAGQLTLAAGDGTLLAVFSRYTYVPGQCESSELKTGQRLEVVKAAFTAQRAKLHFADGGSLMVDLSADAYTGPEAMVLSNASGQIVVWS